MSDKKTEDENKNNEGGIRDPFFGIKGSPSGRVDILLGDIIGVITSTVDSVVKGIDLVIETVKLPNNIGNAYDNTNAPGSNNNPAQNVLGKENFKCQHNLEKHIKNTQFNYNDYKSI